MTNDGPASGAACTFPFNYMGVSHNGCTTIDGDARPWCITQTISGGDMAASGAWGYCDTTSCPVQGIDDIFIGEEGSNLRFSETATTIPTAPVTTAVPGPGCGNRQNIFWYNWFWQTTTKSALFYWVLFTIVNVMAALTYFWWSVTAS